MSGGGSVSGCVFYLLDTTKEHDMIDKVWGARLLKRDQKCVSTC